MNRHTLGILLAASSALTAGACIQGIHFKVAPDPAQLPADLFKQPVRVRIEPLKLELPAPGGGTTLISVGQTKPDPHFDAEELIRDFEAAPGKHTSFADRNDYGAALLFAGRHADAVAVFVQIEKDFPGRYETAANLGTGYELIDDLPNAVIWIRTGIERNADSHHGTEWLHLAILDAKQKLKENPRWLVDHSVLDGQTGRSPAEIERALEYQLNERLYFIRNNDPVMCDLMYQAAAITKDPAKRDYYLKQVPRFGSIRTWQAKKLKQG